LDGDIENTWKNPESDVLWLSDLVPRSIPSARILSVGYEASAINPKRGGSADSIQQYAETLVADIYADRSDKNRLNRPIIFICHGLGGVIVKRALAHSFARTTPYVQHLRSIATCTYAILFFGTPHLGTEKGKWIDHSHGHGLHLPGKRPLESVLLSAIGTSSATLETINDEFASLMERLHLRIFFFWEGIKSNIGGELDVLIPQYSAAPTIARTERAGISATHAGMVQFASDTSPGYSTVIEALVRYAQEAPDKISRAHQMYKTLDYYETSFAIEELVGTSRSGEQHPPHQIGRSRTRNKFFELPRPVTSHFVGRESITDLLRSNLLLVEKNSVQSQQRRFVLYGMPGSGKTELCCKFAQDHRE
jgi:hypothetical protein